MLNLQMKCKDEEVRIKQGKFPWNHLVLSSEVTLICMSLVGMFEKPGLINHRV